MAYLQDYLIYLLIVLLILLLGKKGSSLSTIKSIKTYCIINLKGILNGDFDRRRSPEVRMVYPPELIQMESGNVLLLY